MILNSKRFMSDNKRGTTYHCRKIRILKCTTANYIHTEHVRLCLCLIDTSKKTKSDDYTFDAHDIFEID